jgi:hypothetical protein
MNIHTRVSFLGAAGSSCVSFCSQHTDDERLLLYYSRTRLLLSLNCCQKTGIISSISFMHYFIMALLYLFSREEREKGEIREK